MIDALIAKYGLVIVFFGCALEGDTVAITSGVLAHRGLMPYGAVLAAAMLGAWAADVGVFLLARRYRDHPRVLRALAHPRSQRLARRLLSRPRLLASVFRFLPGLRTLTPVLLATATPMRTLPYVCITGIAAGVWAAAMVLVGHVIGTAIAAFWGHVTRTELLLAVPAVILVGLGVRRFAQARLWDGERR